jgi:serine protease Do
VELAKAVQPGVVNVSTTQRTPKTGPEDFFRRFFEGPQPQERGRQALGSGFIVSADGYVGTNYHVVKGASEIVVRLADHTEHRARLVGSDAKTDIALLKIEASSLPTLAFGDSDRLQVGEPVMAIGNPFGLDQTVTTGIVSAKERFIGAGPYDDFIQTDASINPGNSGGPLVDARGALVGINSAIFSQSGGSVGIGFAIPINIAKDVLPQLRERGSVVRGYLGVAVGPVPADVQRSLGLPPQKGALVAEVVPRSPAAQAGLAKGDVVTAFQNAPIQSPNELTRRVSGTPPGTQTALKVVRAGSGERTVSATLGRLRDEPASDDR